MFAKNIKDPDFKEYIGLLYERPHYTRKKGMNFRN
jgi:hypothetical protein